jgi:hypothetical protein
MQRILSVEQKGAVRLGAAPFWFPIRASAGGFSKALEAVYSLRFNATIQRGDLTLWQKSLMA